MISGMNTEDIDVFCTRLDKCLLDWKKKCRPEMNGDLNGIESAVAGQS